MRLHQREIDTREVEMRIIECLIAIQKEFGLTEAEYGRVLINVLSSQLRSIFTCQLRMERHGNTETPADEAGD